MTARRLRVGIIGHGFVARVHTNAWSVVSRAFPTSLQPELAALAGHHRPAAEVAAARLGWASVEDSWEDLVRRSDIDVVDICTPDYLHAAIAIAALDSGKHVLCEKPIASTEDEAVDMVSAADRAASDGVRAMVGFNYRYVPALELSRRLVLDGRLGRITHLRSSYLQDWLANSDTDVSWKLDPRRAPLGALPDLGSHVVDLAQFVTGCTVERLVAVAAVGDDHGPADDSNGGSRHSSAASKGTSLFLAELTDNLVASFEVSRVAAGHWNDLQLEIGGTEGSIRFRLERLNELELFDRRAPAGERGFRNILITEKDHPWLEGWWPPGHILGWEHAFTHEIAAFIEAIAEGYQPRPSFAEGLQIQRVIGAVVASSASRSWSEVRS